MPVRQLPSGRWQARFKSGGVERSRSTFETEADAAAWEELERAKAVLDGPVTRDQAFVTVAAYAARWLDGYRTPTKSAKTLEHHEGALRRHILPVIGSKRMREVTATDVQRVVDRAAADVSVETARAVFATLSAMFTYARDGDRVLTVSPILPKKHKPKVQRQPMTWLEPDEAKAVAAVMTPGWPRDAFVVLTQTGMRWGEMAGLAARGDLDVQARTLDVRRTVNDVEAGPLKNHKRRTIPLSTLAFEVLARWHQDARDVAPIGDLEVKTSDLGRFRFRWLLQNGRGTPLDNSHFASRHLRPALQQAGIVRRVRPHDLRHSYVSWMIAAGLPVAQVAQLIGDLPSTVERTYSHMLRGAGAEGVAALDRMFG